MSPDPAPGSCGPEVEACDRNIPNISQHRLRGGSNLRTNLPRRTTADPPSTRAGRVAGPLRGTCPEPATENSRTALERIGVVIQPLPDLISVPARKTRDSVGYEVHAHLAGRTLEIHVNRHPRPVKCDPILLLPTFARAPIPRGFRARVPVGCEVQLRLRSSIALRSELAMPNSPTTSAPDHAYVWMLLVANVSGAAVQISHRERIAQIVFAPALTARWLAGDVLPHLRPDGRDLIGTRTRPSGVPGALPDVDNRKPRGTGRDRSGRAGRASRATSNLSDPAAASGWFRRR
jgi:dUTPase